MIRRRFICDDVGEMSVAFGKKIGLLLLVVCNFIINRWNVRINQILL